MITINTLLVLILPYFVCQSFTATFCKFPPKLHLNLEEFREIRQQNGLFGAQHDYCFQTAEFLQHLSRVQSQFGKNKGMFFNRRLRHQDWSKLRFSSEFGDSFQMQRQLAQNPNAEALCLLHLGSDTLFPTHIPKNPQDPAILAVQKNRRAFCGRLHPTPHRCPAHSPIGRARSSRCPQKGL